jgi:aminoglycoside/choline kinase family phosphotransferase
VSAVRDRDIEDFLGSAGWPGADRRPLAQDASFRRYDRISLNGRAAVLMDAPPGKEDVVPFVRIAEGLADLGLSAPRIIARDVAAGFLLLEDLGDATFTRLLAKGEAEGELYDLAVDVLVDLHSHPVDDIVPAGTPVYDDALFLQEALLFPDWYLKAHLGDAAAAGRAAYEAIWTELLPQARGVPETLVLRDFHVDNLMRIEGRDGVAACGLLDFQDAVRGPVAYDFVSLVEDARRDVAPATAARARERYLAAFPAVDAEAFDLSCAVLGAQRHCKVLGIFTRLRDRDGKSDYMVHIPRLWRLLDRAASHPELAPLKSWLDENVPTEARMLPPPREVG